MIYRSPHAEVEIPETPLHSFVLRHAERLADKPAIIDGPSGRTYSYAELAGAVRAAARGWQQRGFKKGDVAALYSPNLPEYAIAYFAASMLGGIVTTLNPLNTAGEVARQLADSGARFLVTVPPLMEKTQEAIAVSGGIEEVFVFGEAEGATPFASVVEEGKNLAESKSLAETAYFRDVEIDPRNDLVALPYSSGTTGMPKGVMLTHHNLVANLCQFSGAEKLDPDTVVIAVLPFFHIYGMIVLMCGVLVEGCTLVTMPRFDLEEFLQTIQDHRINRLYVVPPILLALAKHPVIDNYDLSAVDYIGVGAAPVSVEIAEACSQRLGCRVREGYGLTEASPVTHFSPYDETRNRPGSAGPCIPNTEFLIADLETGEPLGPGEDGEVWVRGPQVMQGYLNRPDETAITVDEDGWLHTGDIGHADEDGYIYLVDRAKELIKYKGYQVAPAELESLLISHPEIADAAVIPHPDEEAGEVPKAFVVRSADISADEIMSFVAGEVAPYKKIRHIEFIDEIPKSLSGKILRRVLIEQDRAAS